MEAGRGHGNPCNRLEAAQPCWELSLCPLEVQQVLLTAESSSFQPRCVLLRYFKDVGMTLES